MKMILTLFISFASLADAKHLEFGDIISDLELTNECKSLLVNTNESLYSEQVANELININDFNNSVPHLAPIDGLDFYHYTNFDLSQFFTTRTVSENLVIFEDKKGYDDIFRFLKTRTLHGCCGRALKAGMFIAEDPLSSQNFGSHRLSIQLKDDTKIITSSNKGRVLSNELSWDIIFQELKQKIPSIKKICNTKKLRALILEASGVDLIAYYDTPGDSSGKLKSWFILLNSRSVNYSEFLIKPISPSTD